MRRLSSAAKIEGKTIAFVPTMGYLHDGHISLVKTARKKSDIVVVSIFVNPIQFEQKEDLDKYPRDIKMDSATLKTLGVDILFSPDEKEMYKGFYKTHVEVDNLGSKLCGKTRPDHFKGVTTVVAKLLSIVNPDIMYLGLKDFQQQVIIKKMIGDLNIPVKVTSLPTVREKDGLAMSSRNSYLNQDERKAATVLFRALKLAEKLAHKRVGSADNIKKQMKNLISSELLVKIDYISICNPLTFEESKNIKSPTLVAIAAHVGKTRLIDNIII